MDALIEEGTRQAEARLQQRDQERFDLFCLSRWHHYHDDARAFILTLASPKLRDEEWHRRLPIEENDLGYPYLRVTLVDDGDSDPPAEDGNAYPIRVLLTLAHDLGVGLITSDFIRDSDEEPSDIPLSLGGVISLLHTGDLLSSRSETVDLSDPDALQITLPTPWNVSSRVISTLALFYRDSDAAIRRDLSDYRGPRFAWATDELGAGMLVIAPANQGVLSYLKWMLPPGTTAAGEMTPRLAKFPLALKDEDDGSEGSAEPYGGATEEGRRIALSEDSLFIRAQQGVYGRAGEPYEVLLESDDDEIGRPLMDFALPCYELGRGIALRSRDGAIIWRVSLGDVIGFLWEGAIPEGFVPYGENANSEPPQPKALDPRSLIVTAPDQILLPNLTRRGITWVLNRAGVPSPRTGLMYSDTGEPLLCFGPTPTDPELRQWAQWRIGWYLPAPSRSFTLIDYPALIPYPI